MNRGARTILALVCAATLACGGPPPDDRVRAERQTLRVTPVRYELDLAVDYDGEKLTGRARIDLLSLADATLHEIPLLLYRLLEVSAVRDCEGRELPFTQVVTAFEDFGQLQVNSVRVELPAGLPAGATTTVELDYGGYLLGYAETGMLYVQDRIDPTFTILRMDSYAYPQPGYPSFAANSVLSLPSYDYLARITVPDSLTVANGGRLVDRSVAGGRATFTFANLRPAWRMDFAIAEYAILEEGPVRVVHFTEDAAGARRVLEAAEASLRLFSEWFGPLQGDAGFTFIEIPDGWGSQADVTAVIQTAAAFKDPARIFEVYHEISHLWNVTATDSPSPRWNEGLAEFLQLLAIEHIDGRKVRDVEVERTLQSIRRRFVEKPAYREIPMVDYGKEQVTGLSYRVGMIMFDVLHRLVGHERFAQIVGEYYRRHSDTGGTTKDLVQLAGRVSERDLSGFFDDWLYTTRWYDLVESGATVDDLVDRYR
jgi:hypothetical protein